MSRCWSRRDALRVSGTGLALIAGCTGFKKADDEAMVDLTVLNESAVDQTIEVTIESDDETVFERSYDLPAVDGGVGSATTEDVLEAGQYTVIASTSVVARDSLYGSTCENIGDWDDIIYVTVESETRIEISGTYCGK